MKTTFKHYHIPEQQDLDSAWASGIIILDTNVLLDFYSYGKDTLDDYYAVLQVAKSKSLLWMPYQVGFEFFENRLGIINKQLKQYDNLLSYLETAKLKITELSRNSPSHSQLDFEAIARKYDKSVEHLKNELEKLKNKHPDHITEDKVLIELESLFDDEIVGDNYTEDEQKQIITEGEVRYANNIPPGYKDKDKQEKDDAPSRHRKFGDLFIWKQMIDQAKATKKSIIFVTNDAKDDWIQYTSDKRKIGAKPLLRKEMITEADVDFMLYSADEFLEEAHKRFNLPIKPKSLKEVKKYRELELERIRADEISKINKYHKTDDKNNSQLHARLHYYLRRARIASSVTISSAEGFSNMPKRLLDTLKEVDGLYSAARNLSTTNDIEVIVSVVSNIQRLLNRCRNMILGRPELNLNSLSELEIITERISIYLEELMTDNLSFQE